MVMLDKQGRRFLCFLPKEEESPTGWTSTQQNISTVLMETDKQLKIKTPDELLQPLNDQCLVRVSQGPFEFMFLWPGTEPVFFLFFGVQQEGWWSYEFCHLGSVRQLHVEDVNKVYMLFHLLAFLVVSWLSLSLWFLWITFCVSCDCRLCKSFPWVSMTQRQLLLLIKMCLMLLLWKRGI